MIGPSDRPEYADEVRGIASQHGASVIFATSDASLRSLQPETNDLMDKASLVGAAEAAGLAVPSSREMTTDDINATFRSDRFPMIVKPRTKRPGGRAAVRVDTIAELREAVGDGGLVQPFIEGTTRAVGGVMWDGVMVAGIQQRYLRTFPAGAGTASAAISEPIDAVWETALTKLLATTNGIFQGQFVGSQLIDLNLRPYGSMPLALAAGLNLPDLVCRLTDGESVASERAEIGVRYRWIDGDLRTLWSDVRSRQRSIGSTLAALVPRPRTAHSITMLSDPRPGLVRLRRRGNS